MLVAVTRVLNEDDIIEAFVRHTLAFVDRMVLLDNGSIDRTAAIVAQLRAEGAPLVLLQARSAAFSEEAHNTLLYHTAREAFAPSWVLPLDADEFLDSRSNDLRSRLAALPPDVPAVRATLRNYFADGLDATDLLVPRRMVMRDATERGVSKCFLRGGLASSLTLEAGNHAAWLGPDSLREPLPLADLPGLVLAHYPVRHPVQGVAKAVLGRLKVLAAGGGAERVAQTANHYSPFLDALCRDPAALLRDGAYMSSTLPPFPLVEDPLPYAGAPLRYTVAGDPVMKALQAAAHAAQQLAQSHGELLDADPAMRRMVEAQALRTALLTG